MGGTFGTAIFLTVFFSGSATKIGQNVQVASQTPDFQKALRDPSNSAVAHAMKAGITSQLNDTSFLKHGAAVLRDPFLMGFAHAMDSVFLLAAVIMVPGFVLSFFLKEVQLRSESGLQAQAAERTRLTTTEEAEPARRRVVDVRDWRQTV
jgi:hypothetical protein